MSGDTAPGQVPAKVAFVYPIPFGDEGRVGGGERYAHELARAMAALVPTVLVTTGRRRESRREGSLAIEVHPWWALVRGVRANPLTLGFLASLRGADVVHCLSYSTLMTDLSLIYGRLGGCRLFITDVGGGGDLTLARWLNVAALAHRLLLLSDFAGRLFPRSRPPRSVIYGGVDTDRFRPGRGQRGDAVLYVGRILAHKGINYLIDAVGHKQRLVICGRPYDVAYFQHLRRKAEGRNVVFVTDADDDRIIAEYQSCGAFVSPSVYEDWQGNRAAAPELLGLTLLEAMSSGAPAICTRVGSLPELVEEGVSGLLVPPNDSAALAVCIRKLLGDPKLAAHLGMAARERVLGTFTWRRTAERCLAAYAS